MSWPESSEPCLRIPPWLRVKLPRGKAFASTKGLLSDLALNTVCQSARCPNTWECFSQSVATFLILGRECTRNCAFCNISPGAPEPPDPDEPRRVAEGAARLGLRHAVVTSVTRDDLPDGGAAHFAETIRQIRARLPNCGPQCTVEVLIPDFQGHADALNTVLAARPDVLNHNVETPARLYPAIRPQADYGQSLELLRRAAQSGTGIPAKSGLMAGLGETHAELCQTIRDLAQAGCAMITVGQYMRPSRSHPAVERYLPPEEFEALAEFGRSLGVARMFCAPLVRSSYHAAELAQSLPE